MLYNWDDPQVGFEQYLKLLNPSVRQEGMLRSNSNAINKQYNAWVGEDWLNRNDPGAGGVSFSPRDSMGWIDWLAQVFDSNRMLNRYSPQSRGENPSRFGGRARWISF